MKKLLETWRSFEPKTVARVSKKAFTLAEVLITLVIIGVVAALTIPTVVAKYQQKAYYTAFMKTYNTLSNAVALSQIDNGSLYTWNFDLSEQEFIEKYFAPYIKNNGFMEIDATMTETVKSLSGESLGTYGQKLQAFSSSNFLIANDSSLYAVILYAGGSKIIEMIVDTNGLKGPNTFGRDIFYIQIGYRNALDGKYADNELVIGGIAYVFDYGDQYCDVHGVSTAANRMQGQSCSAKLLREGAMNY